MRSKVKVLVFVLLIMSLLFVNSNAYLQDNNINLCQRILEKTNSQIEEYGIRASFEIEGNGEEVCVEILKNLDLYEKSSVNSMKSNEMYCLEFNNYDTAGYIESMNFDNHNVVTVNVSKKDSTDGMKELKNKIENSTRNWTKNKKFFQYVKAKLPYSDISNANSDVIKILKKDKAKNIDTVKISNGYSTVAYTKNFETIKNNGKLMDFNFAVCRYSSGNYLIMGSPIITINY